MANKLYEETHIQNIADAIREKTGTTDTYTIAQMADGVRNIVTSGEQNLLVYTGEITEEIKGADIYFVLAKSDFLAEHRNDEKLFVRVEFDIEPTAYSIVKTWAFNSSGVFPAVNNTFQYMLRYDSNSSDSANTGTVPINTDSPTGVGCIQITKAGELRIYSNSSNFAIRPSTYTVTVEW